jgi:hypothetical protein
MLAKNILRTTLLIVAFVATATNLSAQAPYKAAIGIRTGYYGNIGLDVKYFINEKAALEVMASTRSYGSSYYYAYRYRYNEIMALYQIQSPLKLPETNIEGFSWYYGGGASIGFFSNEVASNSISLAGVVGTEYKFPKIPLTLSIDWMPRYFISSNVYWSGFSSSSGGLRIAYYFGGDN